ncbi:MAG: 50S ribosomal protein L25 [Ignavibacteriae bacterium]|nr:50S ribosomal protein L25 [Ignavibacteriota bacterium]
MSNINIAAQKREKSTKGAVNQLKRDGKVPGVLYSKDMEPVNITVTELSLKPVVYTTEMNLVDLKINENEPVPSILKDIQFDPLTDRIIHVDFQAITVGEVIEVQVPISLIGSAIGVKEGGKLIQTLHKFDVECLPKDIPSHLDIDVTNLHVGDSISVADLSYENITILNSEDTSVVAVTAIKEEEEDKADELLGDDEEKQPEVIGKGKSDEESEG